MRKMTEEFAEAAVVPKIISGVLLANAPVLFRKANLASSLLELYRLTWPNSVLALNVPLRQTVLMLLGLRKIVLM
jgi:hypothetical protein